VTTSVSQGHIFGRKAVTAAATAEAIDSTSRPITELLIIANDDNTGRVFYGASDVDSSTQRGLAAGESVVVGGSEDSPFDIAAIFVDVSVSGEAVDFVATRARRGAGA
jgi:hypothetical protein